MYNNNMIDADLVKKYLFKNEPDIQPELKKEHELSETDRMYIINKKIDESFIHNTYDALINKKKFIYDNNTVSVNDYVFSDIEFMQDHYSDECKSIFSKVNQCHTKIGSLILKNIFLKPIYDISILKKRQELFQNMISIKNKVQPLLVELKDLEHELIWFWNDTNLKHIDTMSDLIYFNYDIIPFFDLNTVLNNNEKALLFTNIYKIIVAPMLTIITPLISVLLPLIFLFYMKRKANIDIPFTTILSQYFKTLFGSEGMNMFFKNESKAILASVVTKGIYLFMYLQNIYYSFQSSMNTNKIINIIHDKLNKLTKYIDITNKIKYLCDSVKIVDLSPFITYHYVADDLSVYEMYFNFPVFRKSPQVFSNKGKILTIFQKFRKNKDKMVNIFHYTGLIDAIYSIQNIISNSTSENPYCITTYLNKKKPTIVSKDIWHPYLTDPKTVKNSLDLKNNVLITGPNAAGKSTFIKSVIVNIILSQTIGISSASVFEMTPFYMIETYLHIPDSKGASSLFEAEMIRSKEYIDKLKNLDPELFSFIVLDEIFSSTNYVEGFSGAYSILKKIASFTNTLSITTTHYTDLEILEKDTDGKILNYKFEVDHDEHGEIVFNYVLKRGMSRQYIALELLKNNGFDDDVIKDAMDICNKIKDNKIISFATKNETLLESDITDGESSNESPTISKKKEKKEQKEKKKKKIISLHSMI